MLGGRKYLLSVWRSILRCCSFCILSGMLDQGMLLAKTREVSLMECIKIALQHHPQVKISNEDKKGSIAKYQSAKSYKKPQIYIDVRTIRGSTENIKTSETSDATLFGGLTGTYMLTDPQRSDIENISKVEVDLSKVGAMRTRDSIIYNVKDAYFEYVLAFESRILQQELMIKFKIKLDMATKLYKNGQRPILDVSKAQVDLADARLELQKERNHETLSKAKLLASMGIVNEDIDVVPVKLKSLPDVKYTLKEFYKLSEYYNPDIKIARLSKKINRLRIDMEKSGKYPRSEIFGAAGFKNEFFVNDFKTANRMNDRFLKEGNWGMTYSFGFQLRMPFFDGGNIAGRVDAAIAEYRKTEYKEKEILFNTRGLIRAYIQALNELKRQVEISGLIIENAKKHLVLAQKSYENGVGSQLDMQDAEMSVVRSQMSLVKARYEYHRILAKLSNIVGLDEEQLCKK